jgi:GntR family transcriptional regulator / MocR family aminotransferase
MQLPLEIDADAPLSLQTQLIGQISTSITTGRLKPGSRLPGTRALSEQLGVSRNTVLLAYGGLAAEGYVETREGAGTFVSAAAPEQHQFVPQAMPQAARTAPRSTTQSAAAPKYNFELESIDPDLFPGNVWRRLMMRRMQSSRFNLTQQGDPKGSRRLRDVLCRFLGATRGMTVDAEQIVIVTSIQQALNVVAQMLVRPGTKVITETPGCSLIAPLYQRYGADIMPVPVDHDGLMVEHLPECRHGVAVVTPARQFPLGATMPAARRQALLDWAVETDAHVFEVDFDSDFRYEGSPQPAMQAMDRAGRFIYAGSFAMTIGPGLRIGYLVLPPDLVERAIEATVLLDYAYPCQGQGVPWLEQAVLTDFIESGGYDKHLRRLRRAYLERRDHLAATLAQHFADLDLLGMSSGTHVIWRMPNRLAGALECEARARAAGIAVYTLKFKTISGAESLPGWDRYLLLGFAALKVPAIGAAINRLARSLQ